MTSKFVSLIKETARQKNLGEIDYLILEAKKRKTRAIQVGTGSGGDAAGKVFEIHVAKHIGHILRGGDSPEEHYPEHFSDESGDSPKASLEKQKQRIGTSLHDQIDHHARRMAHHIVNHMRKQGIDLDHTARVHWTSKPNDLERLTGKKGIKGTADITITHKGQHHGISLKYSTSGTKPSLRSPGIKDLNTLLQADEKHVNKILKEHDSNVDRHVGKFVGGGSKKEKHEKFKNLIASDSHSPGYKAATNALSESKSAHRRLSTHYSDSFNKLSHEDKIKFIRKMNDAEEQPTIKPYRASYNGLSNSSEVTNPTKDFDEINSRTHSYSSEVNGATVNVFAHHHDGSKTKVTSFGIKNKGSSPYSSLTGRVGDVSKPKVRKIKVKRKK